MHLKAVKGVKISWSDSEHKNHYRNRTINCSSSEKCQFINGNYAWFIIYIIFILGKFSAMRLQAQVVSHCCKIPFLQCVYKYSQGRLIWTENSRKFCSNCTMIEFSGVRINPFTQNCGLFTLPVFTLSGVDCTTVWLLLYKSLGYIWKVHKMWPILISQEMFTKIILFSN